EVDPAMRLAAMQVQGHREDGELGYNDEIQHQVRPGRIDQALGKEIDYRIEHGFYQRRSKGDYTRAMQVALPAGICRATRLTKRLRRRGGTSPYRARHGARRRLLQVEIAGENGVW